MQLITDVYEMNARITVGYAYGDRKRIEQATKQLKSEVSKHLKGLGYHPRDCDIVARSWKETEAGYPNQLRIVATWSPSTTPGVYLEHGPCDGMICPIPATPTGIAPRAYIFETAWDKQQFTYYRAGIDDENNRWVYTFNKPDMDKKEV